MISVHPTRQAASNVRGPGVSALEDRQASLIRRVVSGETHLFGDLVGPYLPRLLEFTQNRLGSRADAEDVVQEATIKAFRHLADFRFESRFSTWFFRITSNEIHHFRRRKGRAARFENWKTGDENVSQKSLCRDPGPSPLELLERKEWLQRLHDSIQWLPKSLRAVIVLRGIEELSTDDAAHTLNLTSSAVKSRLLRARLQLLNGSFGRRKSKIRFDAAQETPGKNHAANYRTGACSSWAGWQTVQAQSGLREVTST